MSNINVMVLNCLMIIMITKYLTKKKLWSRWAERILIFFQIKIYSIWFWIILDFRFCITLIALDILSSLFHSHQLIFINYFERLTKKDEVFFFCLSYTIIIFFLMLSMISIIIIVGMSNVTHYVYTHVWIFACVCHNSKQLKQTEKEYRNKRN